MFSSVIFPTSSHHISYSSIESFSTLSFIISTISSSVKDHFSISSLVNMQLSITEVSVSMSNEGRVSSSETLLNTELITDRTSEIPPLSTSHYKTRTTSSLSSSLSSSSHSTSHSTPTPIPSSISGEEETSSGLTVVYIIVSVASFCSLLTLIVLVVAVLILARINKKYKAEYQVSNAVYVDPEVKVTQKDYQITDESQM